MRYLHGSSLRTWKQDLTADQPGMVGGILRHGRASVTQWWGPADPQTAAEEAHVREGASVHAEWILGHDLATGVYYRFDAADDDHHIHLSLPRVWSGWLKYKPVWVRPEERTGRARRRWEAKDFEPREIGISISDWNLRWLVWKSPHSWSRSDGWRNSHFNIKDWVLGRTTYSETAIQKVETTVALPEAQYPVEVILSRANWSRPRGFLGVGEHQMMRANVKVLDRNGDASWIPTPGKGESAWDCGEDGTWSIMLPARTVSEALGGLIESVLRERERHGGSVDWRPSTPRALP